MYKALLLDDEKIVRLALKTMVDWNSLGFEISGSYGNAKTALESISGSRPDLIISDIVMPDMDGLSFIEQVRGMGITCPVIILTNHENFTYAVDALRLGVTDYVTKTDISPDSLSALLRRMRKLLDERPEEQPSGTETTALERDLDRISQVLAGTEAPEPRLLSTSFFLCKAFLTGKDTGSGAYDYFSGLLSEKLDLSYIRLMRGANGGLFLVFPASRLPLFLSQTESRQKELLDLTMTFLNRKSGFILSNRFVDTAGLSAELDHCEELIPYASFFRVGALTNASAVNLSVPVSLPSALICRKLGTHLDARQYREAEAMIRSFCDEKPFRTSDPPTARNAVQSFCAMALLDTSSLLEAESRGLFVKRLSECGDLTDYLDLFHSIITEAETSAAGWNKILSENADIRGVCDYIGQHLNQHISLAMLSQHVHMTENYLSRYFKQETGTTVVAYINDRKIEKARKMFREDRESVRTAAESFGYADLSHFVKMFKRITGISPNLYKRFTEDYSYSVLAPQYKS